MSELGHSRRFRHICVMQRRSDGNCIADYGVAPATRRPHRVREQRELFLPELHRQLHIELVQNLKRLGSAFQIGHYCEGAIYIPVIGRRHRFAVAGSISFRKILTDEIGRDIPGWIGDLDCHSNEGDAS
jgi:hypothetical protein